MKGFPNQVADLAKLARGMQSFAILADAGHNPGNDSLFGEALVRSGVAGTGHSPRDIEEYLADQRTKRPQDQSFRTTARGLRELFRSMTFIDDSINHVTITPLGREAVAFADRPMDSMQIAFWRRVIRNMRHDGGDGETSHPYQVLLRLIARKPGIAKPMCALALEARNDSEEELERIVTLSDQSEADAIREIHVTQRNWDNAVKVLPKFAEQLADVRIIGSLHARAYRIADVPGAGGAPAPTSTVSVAPALRPRAPRASRVVTPDTIARAGTAEDFDDVIIPPEINAEATRQAIETRRVRLRRHNLLVRALAEQFTASGATLHEDPMDVLVVFSRYAILVEVKTLDGTENDERDRVRDALGQLLYYEAFVTRPVTGESAIRKIACFERRISNEHQRFLNSSQIGTIWKAGTHFEGNELAAEFIGDILKEL